MSDEPEYTNWQEAWEAHARGELRAELEHRVGPDNGGSGPGESWWML